MILPTIIVIVFGLIIGSFLSVCVYRIPLGRYKGLVDLDRPEDEDPAPEIPKTPQGEVITIAYPPRSFCPHCHKQLAWYHNIPVLSWLFLRGKCAFCSTSISVRYPTIELLSGISAALSFGQFGLTTTGIIIYAFCAALIVISFIDYDYYIIPNVISIPGTVLGIILGVVNTYFDVVFPPLTSGIVESGLGVLFGGGFLLLISEIYMRVRKKVGLGVGDIKLLAMTGAFFGPEAAIYTIFVGSLLGSIFGVLIMLCRGRGVSHPIPFGPYLAVGIFLYIFVGLDLMGFVHNFSLFILNLFSSGSV